MKALFIQWREYIADLMHQQRFTLAALICVASGAVVFTILVSLLTVVIHVFGFEGYTLLILIVAFFFIRYVLKDYYAKFMKVDSDDETGVE